MARPKRQQSPRAALQHELREAIQLNARLRGLMSTQITELEKQLMNDALPMEARMLILEGLSKLLANQARSLEAVAKYSSTATDEPEDAAPAAANILRELRGGRQ